MKKKISLLLVILIGIAFIPRQAKSDMTWCLSIEPNGFELRDGQVIHVNLAKKFDNSNLPELLQLNHLEQLFLSLQAFAGINLDQFPDAFPNLNEIQIRKQNLRKPPGVSLARFHNLLALPALQKLTIEHLHVDAEEASSVPFAKSNVERLDLSLTQKTQLKPILDRVQLTSLRLQYIQDQSSFNADDLETINQQKNLESLSLFGSFQSSNRTLNLSKLKDLHHLKELSLANVRFNPEDLKNFPHLKTLSIRRSSFRDSSFENLMNHPSLETIEVIECPHKWLKITKPLSPTRSPLKLIKLSVIPVTDLKYFANCGCELHLNLGAPKISHTSERTFPCSFTPKGRNLLTEENLSLISQCPNITEFSISGCGATTIPVLAKIADVPSFKSIVLDRIYLHQDDEINDIENSVMPERRNEKLQRLSFISGCKLDPLFVSNMIGSNLEVLSLYGSHDVQVPEEFWSSFDQHSTPKLRSLQLTDVDFDKGQLNLPADFSLPALETLKIEFSFFGMDALKSLLDRCKNLEQLLIHSSVKVKEADLTQLNEFKKLNTIELFNCDVDPTAAAKLNAKHVRIGGKDMFDWN